MRGPSRRRAVEIKPSAHVDNGLGFVVAPFAAEVDLFGMPACEANQVPAKYGRSKASLDSIAQRALYRFGKAG